MSTLFGSGRVNLAKDCTYGNTVATTPFDDRMIKPSLVLSRTCEDIHKETQSLFHEKNFFEYRASEMSVTNPQTSVPTYANRHMIKHFCVLAEFYITGPLDYIDWDCIFKGLTGLETVQIAVHLEGGKDELDEFLDKDAIWKIDALVGLFFRASRACPVQAGLKWGPWDELIVEGSILRSLWVGGRGIG